MTIQNEKRDVLIIGGGIAGLVAANRAAQLGKTVLVLEKGRDQKYLCNTRYTGGTFHICLQDMNLSEEHLLNCINVDTGGFARPALASAVAHDSKRLIRWLQQEGIRFVRLSGAHSYVLAPPGRTGPGLDWEGKGGDVLMRTLETNLERRGGKVARGMRARALHPKPGEGIEVEVEHDGGVVHLSAQSVILADGGFQGDIELLRGNISDHPEKILQRGASTGTGDGLKMAQAIGAAIDGLECFYGHLLSRDAMHNNKLWPRPYLDSLVTSGIVVGADGLRFADEGLGGIYLANAVARLDDPLSATTIFDHDTWEGPGRTNLIAANPHLVDAGGTVHKAASIAELAALASLPVQKLQDTVDAYNKALAGGTLSALGPVRSTDRYKPLPIAKAPFYAVPLCTGITYTMGGILIDENGAVLDKAGNTIDGLYAAGTTTGGLEGGPIVGWVGGLTKSGVTALRAAERIAGFAEATAA